MLDKTKKFYEEHKIACNLLGGIAIGTVFGLTVGYMAGDVSCMLHMSKGLEKLHKKGYIQFNDPLNDIMNLNIVDANKVIDRDRLIISE